MRNKLAVAVLLLSTTCHPLSTALAQGTVFTYQGRLTQQGVPANGAYDFRFRLFDAATNGSSFGGDVVVPAVASNGLFTATLGFDPTVFDGSARWLDIGVRTNGSPDPYLSLEPRQPITATPYAFTAGKVTGSITDQQLSGNIARLNSNAVFTGAVVFSNAANQFSGSFTGNGAGVTNVNLATVNSQGTITPNASLFSAAYSPGVGAAPFGVVAVDVNGDGKLDLISANFDANVLALLTNNGSGAFLPAASLTVGAGPRALVAVDVNGDGKVDLISANYYANTLSVLTNNGSGGFVLAASPGVGYAPHSVTAADVNGDGKVDLISADYGDNTLTVLTNNGSGGFAIASSPGGVPYPVSVTTADVNGDGKPDLISGSAYYYYLTILTNNGSGGFGPSSTPPIAGNAYSVATADVNKDGKVDLISANTSGGVLTVLTNDGSGGFVTAATPVVGAAPFCVVAADINGDGRVDLISANRDVSTLSVLTNDGSGGFGLMSSPAVGPLPYSLTAADLNGDGRVDLISANAGDATLSVMLNLPFNILGNFSGNFAGGNINGGNISGGTFSGSGAGVTNVSLPLNSAGAITLNSNQFTLLGSPAAGGYPFGVVATDVNGDGKLDLACANSAANNVGLLINNGNGGFTLTTNLAVGAGPRAVVAADVNGDGKADLITANYNVSTLSVLTNNGSGGFALAASPGVGSNPHSVTAADVNGDGKTDLISADAGAATLTVLTNNGSGGFTLAASPVVGSFPASVVAADVNGDGKADLICANALDSSLSVLTNNGSGGFVASATLAVGAIPFAVTAADVNGDGKVDLITASRDYGYLTVLLNNGSGGFVPAYFPSVGEFPYALVVADVNGDGRPDLISANRNAGTLTVLTNNGNGFGLAATLAVGTLPYALTAADVNGDGRVDLISASAGDGTLSVLLNASLNFLGNFNGRFTGSGSGLTGISRLDAPDGSPAPALAVDNNGNVGVGLTGIAAPHHRLSLAGGPAWTANGWGGAVELENASAIGWQANAAGQRFGMGHSGGGFYFFRTASDPGTTANPAAYDLSITDSGIVGIFGANALELGAGVAGKEPNAGKIGYQTFTPGTLDIVGAGTLGSNRKIKFWCEGGATFTGVITAPSDRNLKQDFQPLDGRAVLEKVVALPVQSWAYKFDDAKRHIGPVAQDFHSAFGLNGDDETAIATVDADGVALAAIQGLNQKLTDELKRRDVENAKLTGELAELKQLVQQLVQTSKEQQP